MSTSSIDMDQSTSSLPCTIINQHYACSIIPTDATKLWCTHCYAISYCCRTHQTEHWSSHKLQCRKLPLELQKVIKRKKTIAFQYNSNLQTYDVIARKAIEVGDILLTEMKEVNSTYFTPNNDAELVMAIISIAYQLVINAEYSEWIFYLAFPYLFNPDTPKHALFQTVEILTLFQDGIPVLVEPENPWSVPMQACLKKHSQWSKTEWSMALCAAVFAQTLYKRELIKGKPHGRQYLSLSLGTTLLNHSCRPNAVLSIEESKTMVISESNIPVNTILTISYRSHITNFYPRLYRINLLFKENGFFCKCNVCEDPDSLEEKKLLQYNSSLPLPVISSANDDNATQRKVFLTDYETLRFEMGMHQVDLSVVEDMSLDNINKWCEKVQIFIDKYSLSDQHWCAHTLHQWTVRILFHHFLLNSEKLNTKQRQSSSLLLQIYNQTLKNIKINSIILSRYSVDKNIEFSLVRAIGKEFRRYSEKQIEIDIEKCDHNYEIYKITWVMIQDKKGQR